MKFTCFPTPTRLQVLATVVNLFLGLTLSHSLSAQQPGYDRLDHFYAEEIGRFNRNFEEHIKQLDKCLHEMDSFEKGEIFLQPVECPKFNEMRPKARDLLEEVKVVMMSYDKILEDAMHDYLKAGVPLPAFEKTGAAQSQAMSLIKTYEVKFQQAQLQSRRAQKLEGELVKELEGLGQLLKELQSNKNGSALAGNPYIEFGQFDKVRNVSIAAGALYACSEDEGKSWEKRNAYQFLHFKLDQVVTDYFKLIYRVIAVRDMPLADRVAFVDQHRKVEGEINALQQGGYGAVKNAKMKCDDAGAFASEVLKYSK